MEGISLKKMLVITAVIASCTVTQASWAKGQSRYCKPKELELNQAPKNSCKFTALDDSESICIRYAVYRENKRGEKTIRPCHYRSGKNEDRCRAGARTCVVRASDEHKITVTEPEQPL